MIFSVCWVHIGQDVIDEQWEFCRWLSSVIVACRQTLFD